MSKHNEKNVSIDPGDVFAHVVRMRPDGQLPEKVDCDKKTREEITKLKNALGHEKLSNEEFLSLYQEKANGVKQKLRGSVTRYEQPTEPVWPKKEG